MLLVKVSFPALSLITPPAASQGVRVRGLQGTPSCSLGDPARGETEKSLLAGHLLNGRACSPVCSAVGTNGGEQGMGVLSMGPQSLGVDVNMKICTGEGREDSWSCLGQLGDEGVQDTLP